MSKYGKLDWVVLGVALAPLGCSGDVGTGDLSIGAQGGANSTGQVGDPTGNGAASMDTATGSTGIPGAAGTNGVRGPSVDPSGTAGTAGVGAAGDPDEAPPADAASVAATCTGLGSGVHAGVTRLRRMTRAAYDNTIRDLLGVVGEPSRSIELDESIGPFYSNAIAPVTDLIVRQHQEAANAVMAQVVSRRDEIAGCDLTTGSECVTSFVASFGLRAFRRPLDATEMQSYVQLFAVGEAEGGVDRGFSLVVSTLLQSPFFLYFAESGAGETPTAAPVLLTAYELASRLSYFLWNTMPDEELFTLAESGTLTDPTVLAAQVTRMLTDPKAKDSIPLFHLQWLGIGEMQGVTKSTSTYPAFDDALRDSMLAETASFSDYVIREGDGLVSTLLSASFSVFEGPLFELYGVTEPAAYVPGTPVMLDPTQRAGILTQAAFLTKHAHPDQTSPVHRGIMVRENLLCQTIPSPPANVNNVAPMVTEATTTRQRFAQHEADPACAACHVLIDPIGLGFESYDAVGAWRTVDGTQPVDATGTIHAGGPDIDGPFDGAVALAQKLAASEQVRVCLANQWFRYSLGRIETNDDACTLQGLYAGFTTSGDIRALLAGIATSDAFRHVRLLAEDTP